MAEDARSAGGLFGVPPGADYPAALVAGLIDVLDGAPPEAMARTLLLVNSARMQRAVRDAFLARGEGRLLPRIVPVGALADDPALGLAPAGDAEGDPLARRFELARLVLRLIEADPSLAPRSAAFDLADSLAALFDEMEAEGVAADTLGGLEIAGHAAHWERARAFLSLLAESGLAAAPGPEARLARAVAALSARWADAPPAGWVIMAGSTGSRAATARLIETVARLPRGAVVLPGHDGDMPASAWAALEAEGEAGEDHPQYRFLRLARALGADPAALPRWGGAPAPDPARNRLLSLALRPAPVTDQWLAEGPGLGDLQGASAGLALLEAPSPRLEALALALRLRAAAEEGARAVLVCPDRVLTRQVTAALSRWGLTPDDSAGEPLSLSPPGRLMRQVAGLMAAPLPPGSGGWAVTGEALVALLKHPLVHAGPGRGAHLLHARALELRIRDAGWRVVDAALLDRWARQSGRPGAEGWAGWLTAVLAGLPGPAPARLEALLAAHVALADGLCAGHREAGISPIDELREGAAGAALAAFLEAFAAAAPHGPELAPSDYAALFRAALAREGAVREPVGAHPRIAIRGTVEARTLSADLVLLAGLSEGIWPALPPADPWLSRAMRGQAGLLSPERRVGLQAHDFQQAAGAPGVVLSRSLRDAEAPLVPARWLNRLTGLLGGLGPQGRAALSAMRARGRVWVEMARAMDRPAAPAPAAPRPAPRPPVVSRPLRLSVTEIERLIRDPYAIYARHVLRLAPLRPLRPEPDALLRGTVIHAVLERFVECLPEDLPEEEEEARALLLDVAGKLLDARVSFPAIRRLWLGRLRRAAPGLLAQEAERRARARPLVQEARGEWAVSLPDGAALTLVGKADRVDLRHDGRLELYDYKTGAPPTQAQIRHFDRQLPLLALMAEAGMLEGVPAAEVAHLAHLSIRAQVEERAAAKPDELRALIEGTGEGLVRLLAAYRRPDQGFASRRAVDLQGRAGDYDHLARYGEWSLSDPASPEDVG